MTHLRALLVVLVLALPLQAQVYLQGQAYVSGGGLVGIYAPNVIYSDFLTDFTAPGVAPGTLVTLSIATNATRSFVTGPWTYEAGNAPQSNTNMYVWTNKATLRPAPIWCDGSSYNLTQTTNIWELTNANYQFLTYQMPNPGPTMSWFYIVRVTESGNSVGYNINGMELGGNLDWANWTDDPATGFWKVETASVTPQHIAAVGYTNMYLYFTGMANTNLGQTMLWLYTNSAPDMSGTWSFVGSSSNTLPLGAGTGTTVMDLGRMDVHGNVAASKFDFIMAGVDMTYAHFPMGPLPWTNPWAPVLSAIVATPGQSNCVITWSTDHSANSGVNWGATSAYGNNTNSLARVRSHSMTVTNLFSNTTYHYQVLSTNALGLFSASSDGTFTTTPIYTYIYQQDFETGMPTGWSGTANFAYNTAPAPLLGSFSLDVADGNAAVYTSLGAVTEVWTFCLVNPNDSGSTFFRIRDVSANTLLNVGFSGSEVSVTDGTATATTSGAGFSLATTYRLWTHYKKGTGANAVLDVWWSLTDTLQTDAAHHATTSSGVGTTGADRIDLEAFFGVGGQINIFDKLRVSTSSIGSNPN